MKQLVNELNDYFGKSAYATYDQSDNSIVVFPKPDYDFFTQVTIEGVVTFCKKHHLHFYVNLDIKTIDIYNPKDVEKIND